MRSVSIGEAKNQWSKIIHDVEKGQDITLTRRGQPVARFVGLVAPE